MDGMRYVTLCNDNPMIDYTGTIPHSIERDIHTDSFAHTVSSLFTFTSPSQSPPRLYLSPSNSNDTHIRHHTNLKRRHNSINTVSVLSKKCLNISRGIYDWIIPLEMYSKLRLSAYVLLLVVILVGDLEFSSIGMLVWLVGMEMGIVGQGRFDGGSGGDVVGDGSIFWVRGCVYEQDKTRQEDHRSLTDNERVGYGMKWALEGKVWHVGIY